MLIYRPIAIPFLALEITSQKTITSVQVYPKEVNTSRLFQQVRPLVHLRSLPFLDQRSLHFALSLARQRTARERGEMRESCHLSDSRVSYSMHSSRGACVRIARGEASLTSLLISHSIPRSEWFPLFFQTPHARFFPAAKVHEGSARYGLIYRNWVTITAVRMKNSHLLHCCASKEDSGWQAQDSDELGESW